MRTLTLYVLPDEVPETSSFLNLKGDTVTIVADGPCVVLFRHASAAPKEKNP